MVSFFAFTVLAQPGVSALKRFAKAKQECLTVYFIYIRNLPDFDNCKYFFLILGEKHKQ